MCLFPFNDHRHASLPTLAPATCALLESVWMDDYESFGLVSPDEDPTLFEAVRVLDAEVRRTNCPVLSAKEVAELTNGGWHEAETPTMQAIVEKVDVKVWEALEECFVLIDQDGSEE